jgi:hypothetical protein
MRQNTSAASYVNAGDITGIRDLRSKYTSSHATVWWYRKEAQWRAIGEIWQQTSTCLFWDNLKFWGYAKTHQNNVMLIVP